jgi:hypothetical protein
MPYAIIITAGKINPFGQAPTLLTPANGVYLDLSGTPTFTWTYNPPQGGVTQAGYCFQRVPNNGSLVQYWNATSSTWSTTPIYNSSSAQSVTFTAGSWENNNTYQWAVSTQDNYPAGTYNNAVGPFSGFFAVNAQAIPIVTVTAPTTGSSFTNSTPDIAWITTPAPGTYQASYRLAIYNSTQYGATGFSPGVATTQGTASGDYVYDSGQQGSTSTTFVSLASIPVILPNSTTYRAYLQVTASGGQFSAWEYTQFSISYTAPATPTFSAVVTNGTAASPPLVTLTVGNGATGDTAAILRTGNDGSSEYVRGASLINPAVFASSSVVVIDYECIPTVVYSYTVQTVVSVIVPGTASVGVVAYNVPTGQGTVGYGVASYVGQYYQTSTMVSVSNVMVSTNGWWLLNPLTPTTGPAYAQAVDWEPQITEQSTAHIVMGQAYPNVVANVMGGLDGQATFGTWDPVTYANLQTLLTSQQTIFVSSAWGPTDCGYFRFGPQTGGMSTGSGNTVLDSTLQPSVTANMYRTTAITWVSQGRPPA